MLVDSERLAVRVDAAFLARLGWPLTENEIVERFVGRSDEFMVSEIEAHIGQRLGHDWKDELQQLQREAFEAELRPVDGIVEALDEIELSACVASSGSHAKMRFTLGLVGLYERFEGRIFSGHDVANGKPAPDLFLHAAQQLGVAPAACVVVEDSRYGVEAGRRAGMRVLGYAGGLTPRSRLEAEGALVFDDMRALPRLLAGLS